jgi:histidyl-tRNA synthetase
MSEKKNKKPQKLKARLPRGFVDRTPADIRATDEMVAKIREVYERYGFDPLETPMFEYTDCLGKFLPDSDRPNEGVFSVADDDEQWMSLRYDLTAPLARHVAENINEIQLPFRTYRNGWVFRNEKPGPGRFRQFMQFDADTVGAPGVQADAEMCMMMADVMEALGLYEINDDGNKVPQYVIRVNNRKYLDGVMDLADVPIGKRLDAMRALDKKDRIGVTGVRQLLMAGRWDIAENEGDFTPGLGLMEENVEILFDLIMTLEPPEYGAEPNLRYLDDFASDYKAGDIYIGQDKNGPKLVGATTVLDRLKRRLKRYNIDGVLQEGLDELTRIDDLVSGRYGPDRIRIDPSCVRGLEYYTGMVFEAELTFPVVNEKGETVVFGSVGGGGRYDGLVKRFTGQDVPATGFSIGVSRLMTALKNLKKLGQDEVIAPVLVTVMDGDIEALGRYQKMVQDLRQAGIRAEMYQGNWKKFGNQLKYADRRQMPIAIIQGSDEREKGIVQIKDMIEGRKQAAAIESNEEWRETRPGQYEIAEANLVTEVQKLLAEQKADRDG